MEDNSSSDDEIPSSSTGPKSGGKKLKLNDGSSQDSVKETVVSESKDENVDSGVSADKSESTSSDDRAERAEGAQAPVQGPSNEEVIVAPSSSNVRAILLNIKRPKWSRNYRKRKTPGRDSDSDSSRDSDDLSVDETTPSGANDTSNTNTNSETESEHDIRRLADFLTPESDMSCHSNSASSSSSDTPGSFGSDNILGIPSGDSDTDDETPANRNLDNEGTEESEATIPPVLLKPRPKHSYLLLREIMNREMGLTFPCGKTAQDHAVFESRFYGSLHAVYRLKKLHNLNKHRGCVNSINFHPEGQLLASGSDDTNVVLWDWARNKPLSTIKTGHKSNVFQSKFLFLNAKSQVNIVTCARDGQVRLLQSHPSGGANAARRKLCSHSRAAHKLHVSAYEPHIVISAGEDGLVMQCDVRAEHPSRLFQVKDRSVVIPLYSVCGHPIETRDLIVAGRDKYVRLYDRRKSNKPLAFYCPASFSENSRSPGSQQTSQQDNLVAKLFQGTVRRKVRLSMMHLTCAVYNHNGTEILGSYNDEDIYLFDVKKDVFDKTNTSERETVGYTHRYSGHRNSATFKGVSFYGPRSEYVVSGSDCSYIYIWDKKTESIVQWLVGDLSGVVNCVESHPKCPVLATSGLDKDVKIWMPKSQYDPTYDGIEKVVRENSMTQQRSPLFSDFLPTLYSAWRGENRLFSDDDSQPSGNIEFDGNVCTTF
ncbi:DDB1- and CUL4-associated factor 8 isoform X2 [Spodoptera frugiperda]|uniref:DDB1- and CUL4-associated factor 8 isoform X2 n=1 Tax=Spodoptera frugiperda TaxID=7108 RepID=A0A9R0F4W8_SPOFR|nr:DDB1- and CUL4-associated factor 8 isoform X2 [Spodoptera frugiperda]